MYTYISAECCNTSDIAEDETKSQKHKQGSSKDVGIGRDNVAESRSESSGVQQCNFSFFEFYLEYCIFFSFVAINMK